MEPRSTHRQNGSRRSAVPATLDEQAGGIRKLLQRFVLLALLTPAFLVLAGLPAVAAHTHVKLQLSTTEARPGQTVWAGIQMKMDPGWHTYWKNPGESGMPTRVKWQLPAGVTAGKIHWPLPEKLPPASIPTYGYVHEVVLAVPLKLAPNLKPGPLELSASVSWLECKSECIPGKDTVSATLRVGTQTRISPEAKTIALWRSKTPQPGESLKVSAWWAGPAKGGNRPLEIRWAAPAPNVKADFFPDAGGNFDVQAATERTPSGPEEVVLRKNVQKYSGDWPKEVSGVVIMQIAGRRQGFRVALPVAASGPASLSAAAATPQATGKAVPSGPAGGEAPAAPSRSLWLMLLYAFVGGLILNVMPCVLPVIALKVLGFIRDAQQEPRRVRALGLIYAAGVLVSFLALAALVIGVQSAGRSAGWGMQFDSPVFIVVLTTLITLVALNLFGVFEVTLGGRAYNQAAQLASRQGAAGAFFNGLVATALATPCTAPFLAPALGFAFAQKPSVIVLMFVFVGLGLAAPYVALSWSPKWLKLLPKSGPWMEKFKIAMGFPMLATAVWLFNLAGDYYGQSVLWLGIFLVIVAFAAWIYGAFIQRGQGRRLIAAAVVVFLLVGGYVFALQDQLHWRTASMKGQSASSMEVSASGIDWQPWSPQAVARARSEGRPVLVDFTADWCLTCQVNKKVAIDTTPVRKELKRVKAVALLGDYTHFPSDITAELNRFGRAGVPLVLVYPKNPQAQPIILPQILTPGIVTGALTRAAE